MWRTVSARCAVWTRPCVGLPAPPARFGRVGLVTQTLTVMIVDDHEVVRRGIAEVIDRTEGLSVTAEAGSVAEATRRLPLTTPDVLLVDLQLPDGNGIDIIHAARELSPDSLAVVLTSFDDDDAVAAALDAGARAFVLKSVRGTEIAQVVKSVAEGRTLLDQRTMLRRKGVKSDPTEKLTKSELRILDLIGDGLSNREIAEQLGVAEKTVKNHMTSLLAKMGLKRRTQVVAWVAAHRGGRWRSPDA